jgi:hypothetical protein
MDDRNCYKDRDAQKEQEARMELKAELAQASLNRGSSPGPHVLENPYRGEQAITRASARELLLQRAAMLQHRANTFKALADALPAGGLSPAADDALFSLIMEAGH